MIRTRPSPLRRPSSSIGASARPGPRGGDVPPLTVRGAYDLRGRFPEELDEARGRWLGRRLGTIIGDSWLVGRDTRTESRAVSAAVISGLRRADARVIDLGIAPTPLISFAAQRFNGFGLVVTASHNPLGYVGMKGVGRNGRMFGSSWGRLWRRSSTGELQRRPPSGVRPRFVGPPGIGEIERAYVDAITRNGRSDLRIVVDARGGAASKLAPRALARMGCRVHQIGAGFSPTFHGGSAEPTPGNVGSLAALVRRRQADLGVALDADGDRALFVGPRGSAIDPEAIALLLHRGGSTGGRPIVASADVSERLDRLAPVVRSPVGGRNVTSVMRRIEAQLGFELSSHYYFAPPGGASDGSATACRVAGILAADPRGLRRVLRELGPIPRLELLWRFASRSDAVRGFRTAVRRLKGGTMPGPGLVKLPLSRGLGKLRPSGSEPLVRLLIEAEAPRWLRPMRLEAESRLRDAGVDWSSGSSIAQRLRRS